MKSVSYENDIYNKQIWLRPEINIAEVNRKEENETNRYIHPRDTNDIDSNCRVEHHVSQN